MAKVKITLPDGKILEFDKGVTPKDVAVSIGSGLAKAAISAKVNGELWDYDRPIQKDSKIEIITFDSKAGMQILWHTTSHILAQAVLKLYPETKLTLGPPIDSGFYYDFDSEHNFSTKDFERIEKEMKAIIERGDNFERKEMTKEKALEYYKDNEYKSEIINEKTGKGENITFYEGKSFTDLCKGPHLPDTKLIKAFKLMKTAGAYWRGNEKNKMLQRIYGISFPKKSQLDDYIFKLKEAEKRNHLKLGTELDLFSVHKEGPGFIFFHNNGVVIWNELTKLLREEQMKRHYQHVRTPMIMNKQLWLTSGHYEHYKENMYFTKIDKEDFAVKPMNCPGHILIYNQKRHSYKELPIKIAEFGTVHRHEKSGVLNGLFRVRKFTQDDAHIFATPEKIEEVVLEVIDLIDVIYKATGFESYRMELSTRPEKAMGEKAEWDKAEAALKKALEKSGKKYELNEGDGAFYGPKIDFHIEDSLGRSWQLGTVQLDFFMPKNFETSYIGKDDKKHTPVIIHRAIFGSLERFIGILIEHYAGKFPLWLTPVQAVVLPLTDKHLKYAKEVENKLLENSIRGEIDNRGETLSYRVREAQKAKVFYILVVGDKEEKEKTVTVRLRDGSMQNNIQLSKFIETTLKENKNRKN